jgi:hypothetical protein
MTLEEKIEALKALRGGHDQPMRTEPIKIEQGEKTINGMTPTARDLEARIKRLEDDLHCARMDAFTDES